MGADDYFQKDFEWRFPYEETEDQLKVIEEIKEDLMQNTLTDRLLVADVGFGKTEVALRAAFKVIINGFQVVFLAPTTILTEQHYINFVERFKDMPVNIGLLNRNVSKKKRNRNKGNGLVWRDRSFDFDSQNFFEKNTIQKTRAVCNR